MSVSRPKSFYYLLHPRPVIIVTTKCPDGKINATPIAWSTPVAEDEPTIAIVLDRSSYTFQCIEYCKEVVINIPSQDMVDIVYRLGTVSGRDIDKVKEFNLRLEPSNKVGVPRLSDAIGWIEAKVRQYIDVAEVRLYILDVVDYYGKQDLVTGIGWNLDKASPLQHVIGRAFCIPGRRIYAKTK